MSKNNSLSIFSIIMILALLGLNVYQWTTNSKMKKELHMEKSNLLELEKANSELNLRFESKMEELEGLRGDNQELNAQIDVQKSELSKQKKRISGLIWTEKELGKVKQEIESMALQADQHIAQIARLKQENEALNTSVQSLNAANTELTETVMTNQKRISSLDSVKTILVSQTEELSEVNNTLSTKVDMAEAIKINFIEVKGYDVRDGGEVKEKSRAKKVEMLRACFTTETNLVVAAGEEEFQVRYTNPAGEVLYVESLGSGSITNKLTDKTERYTAAGTIEYKNKDTKACLDWKPNFKLIQGNYTVDIFNNGFLVGKGTFRLK